MTALLILAGWLVIGTAIAVGVAVGIAKADRLADIGPDDFDDLDAPVDYVPATDFDDFEQAVAQALNLANSWTETDELALRRYQRNHR